MAIDWNGRWRNDVGSEVEFSEADGVLQGTYHTGVGRPDAGEGFPVMGTVSGDMIAFTVNFGGHGSVAAWTGRHVDGNDGPAIHTLWHLVRNSDDAGEPLPPWSSTLTGAAIFRAVRHPR